MRTHIEFSRTAKTVTTRAIINDKRIAYQNTSNVNQYNKINMLKTIQNVLTCAVAVASITFIAMWINILV